MDRKDFLLSACTLCGLGLAASLMDSCSTNVPVVNFTLDLNNGANAALRNTGGVLITNGGTVIVMHTSSGFKALSLSCTHAGCIVTYRGTLGFVCQCHGGSYDVNGNVTGGPPPSPLTKYTVTQAGSVLTIKG